MWLLESPSAEEALDQRLLQRIRQSLSKRSADHPLHEVVVPGVRAAQLTRHLRHLLDTGEIRGRVMHGRHGDLVLVRGGLTPGGLIAFQDATGTEHEARQTPGARLRRLVRGGRSGLAAAGWKIIIAIVTAIALGWLGLSG